MRLEAVGEGRTARDPRNKSRPRNLDARDKPRERTTGPKFMAVLCPSPRDTGWCRWSRDRIRGAKILPPFLSFD